MMNAKSLRRHVAPAFGLFLILVLLIPATGCGVAEYERRLEMTRVNGWPKDEPVVTQEQEEVTDEESTEEVPEKPEKDLGEEIRRLRKEDFKDVKALE